MTLFLLKRKGQKKLKEPCEKTVVSPKTKKVIKNEEPSEEELGAPKPKNMKEEKEINGEIREKSPNLKNGFPDSRPDSNSKEAASEENSELEQVKLHCNMYSVSFDVDSGK